VKFVHGLISFLVLAFAGPEGCRGHFWPFSFSPLQIAAKKFQEILRSSGRESRPWGYYEFEVIRSAHFSSVIPSEAEESLDL